MGGRHDLLTYAKWLSQATGQRYRLPTESEWEYAARSRGKNDIWAGTSEETQLEEYAVYQVNSRNRTAPVGEKKPNALGLHDLSGNVFEWVEDCEHNNYNEAPTDGTAWLAAGDGNCGARMRRGGSWATVPVYLRTSSRFRDRVVYQGSDYIGFRLVQDIEP